MQGLDAGRPRSQERRHGHAMSEIVAVLTPDTPARVTTSLTLGASPNCEAKACAPAWSESTKGHSEAGNKATAGHKPPPSKRAWPLISDRLDTHGAPHACTVALLIVLAATSGKSIDPHPRRRAI